MTQVLRIEKNKTGELKYVFPFIVPVQRGHDCHYWIHTKLLQQLNDLSKVTGYYVNMSKSLLFLYTSNEYRRRQWHPTPVLTPGKSHGQRRLVGYSPWGHWELDTTERLHFHALEQEMATHSSVLAWRIPGTGEPGGLPSMGSHRVRHNWSDLTAAAAAMNILLYPWYPQENIRETLNWKSFYKLIGP